MGEAKRRKERQIVYHHTSNLCTNLIWMSGVIQVEGHNKELILHPRLGGVKIDSSNLRRSMKDFPPLAWFTKNIGIPKCLRTDMVGFFNKSTEETKTIYTSSKDCSDAIHMNRMALGFPIDEIKITTWKSYYGYQTKEGKELNDSARSWGDNPDEWYVSEEPIDVLKSCEVWLSRTIFNPKLERIDEYLKDVHRLVRLCHDGRQNGKPVYIPPSWLSIDDQEALAKHLNVPVA